MTEVHEVVDPDETETDPPGEKIATALEKKYFDTDEQEKETVGGIFAECFEAEKNWRTKMNDLIEQNCVQSSQDESGWHIKVADESREAVQQSIQETKNYQIRQETIGIRLNQSDVNNINKFSEKLSENKNDAKNLIVGLLNFQRRRMEISGATGIDEEMTHLINVTGLAMGGNISTMEELVDLIDTCESGNQLMIATINSVHDIVKKDRSLFALAGHEVYSEQAGPEVLHEALLNMGDGYGIEAESVAKIARLAIARHGDGEYPQLEAQACGAEFEISSADGQSITARLVTYPFYSDQFHPIELYVDPPEIIAENLFISAENEVIDQASASSIIDIIEATGVCDKLSGADIEAIQKYMVTDNAQKIFFYTSTFDLMMKLYTKSFSRNLQAIPDHKLESDDSARDIRGRGALTLWLLRAVNNSSDELPDKLTGIDQAADIIKKAKELESKYQAGKGESDDTNKRQFAQTYAELVKQIKSIDRQQLFVLMDGEIKAELSQILREVDEQWRTASENSVLE